MSTINTSSKNELESGLSSQGPSTKEEEITAAQSNEPRTSLSSFKQLGFLDRFLAIWIFLAMALGIILGYFVPETGPALQKGEFAEVSIPIAIGLLVMMYPILCKVRYETLHQLLRLRALWIQVVFSIFINWVVAPLLMVSSQTMLYPTFGLN